MLRHISNRCCQVFKDDLFKGAYLCIAFALLSMRRRAAFNFRVVQRERTLNNFKARRGHVVVILV